LRVVAELLFAGRVEQLVLFDPARCWLVRPAGAKVEVSAGAESLVLSRRQNVLAFIAGEQLTCYLHTSACFVDGKPVQRFDPVDHQQDQRIRIRRRRAQPLRCERLAV
jgi:hypothetical protein